MNLNKMSRDELISYIMQLQFNVGNLEARLTILENAERNRILNEGHTPRPLGPMEVPPITDYYYRPDTYYPPQTGNTPYGPPGYTTS